MAVVRNQFAVESAAQTIGPTSLSTAFLLTRPFTPNPSGSALGPNTFDWVARTPVPTEFNQGRAQIDVGPTFGVAGVAVRQLDILDVNGVVLRTVLAAVTDNSFDVTLQQTKNLLASIILAEGEWTVRLFLYNSTAGSLGPASCTMRMDFGLNNTNYGSVPSLA
jgi:hypothetical protein